MVICELLGWDWRAGWLGILVGLSWESAKWWARDHDLMMMAVSDVICAIAAMLLLFLILWPILFVWSI